MAVFVITWNLNKERHNYDASRRVFLQHLERYENTKDNGLDSVRWISSTGTANQIQEDLISKLDANDRLFVSKVTLDNYQGWLNQQTWDWISARI